MSYTIDSIFNKYVNFLSIDYFSFYKNIDILSLFIIINTILVFSIIFLEFQTASTSWAWILVLLLFPYLDFVFFFFL